MNLAEGGGVTLDGFGKDNAIKLVPVDEFRRLLMLRSAFSTEIGDTK
jgi:hypothetical protein